MKKPIKVEIIPRSNAERMAHILGPSSAVAAALRTLAEMGDDADKFEICWNVSAHSLALIEKQYLTTA